jgi:hypothetical protein
MEPKPAPPEPAVQSVAEPRPVMDVKPPESVGEPVAAPPESAPVPGPQPRPAPAAKEEHPIPPKPVAAKQANDNVRAAITATVIIVFGLAALAVFAFLQQNS